MKEKKTIPKPDHFDLNRREIAIVILGVFLMSFAVLTFEISLTRIFSVMFAYHYAFLAVAIAFAGLGLGGVLGHLFFSGVSKKELFTGTIVVYSLFTFLFPVFTTIAISSTSPDFLASSILFFMGFLPAGIFLATSYKFFVKYGNRIYGADVIGASIGSLAAITFFNGVSPVVTVLTVSSALAIFSLSFAIASKISRGVIVIAFVVMLLTASILFGSVRFGKDVPIGNQGKELYMALSDPQIGARIVESRWSAFGRTDVVEFQNDTHSKIIFIDGGAGTVLYHFDGNFDDPNSTTYDLRFSSSAYPFYFENESDTLIIGPGGGVDVLTALMLNASHVHAVEINQQTVNIVNDYSSFDGGIYENYDDVHVHVDEGRSFLRREATTYDVIMLNIPITKTIQGSSGYSMAENYLFTVDSFKDYLSHLNGDGKLVIVAHDRVEIYKLVVTALQALGNEGKSVEDGMRQIVVAESMEHHMTPSLILRKTPFTPYEASQWSKKSDELNVTLDFIPYAYGTATQTQDSILADLANGKTDLNSLIAAGASNDVDISPPTDDKPFFYKFENGLPFTLPQLLTIFITLAALTTFAYLVDWGRRIYQASKKMKETVSGKFSIFTPYFFASLGLGFMLIETSFVQKFILFLGSPTLTIAVVLFSLLLSMGVGGLVSKKMKEPSNLLLKSSLLIGIMMTVYSFTLPIIFGALLGLDLTSRLAVSFILTFPAGFLLGIPFPTGARTLDQHFDGNDMSWMWGINGLYSLLGSTLAVIIAMMFGFSVALLLGASIYFLIFPIGRAYFKGKFMESQD